VHAKVDGARILQSDTVDAKFTNQIGDLDFPPAIPTADPSATCEFNAGPGWKWGYGLLLNTVDLPGMRRAGSGAWAGLCITHFWVDRTAGICASILELPPVRDARGLRSLQRLRARALRRAVARDGNSRAVAQDCGRDRT